MKPRSHKQLRSRNRHSSKHCMLRNKSRLRLSLLRAATAMRIAALWGSEKNLAAVC